MKIVHFYIKAILFSVVLIVLSNFVCNGIYKKNLLIEKIIFLTLKQEGVTGDKVGESKAAGRSGVEDARPQSKKGG